MIIPMLVFDALRMLLGDCIALLVLYVHLPIYCAIGLESGCVGGMGDLLDRLLEGRYASLPLGNTHTVLHKCRNFYIFPVNGMSDFSISFSKFVEIKYATSDLRKIKKKIRNNSKFFHAK